SRPSIAAVADIHPGFGLSFVLSFNTPLAAPVARTNCSRVSAGAHNRHCRRHNSNPWARANGELKNALGRHSRETFAGNSRQSDGLVRAVARECNRANTPEFLARLFGMARTNRGSRSRRHSRGA